MKWQQIEQEVRRIAESVWSVSAEPERVTGVKCDAVLKIKKDYWILIEISKLDDLIKLREDVAKLALMRQSLMSQQIYSECYFITSGIHTSIRESGAQSNINVHDLTSFSSEFLGTKMYLTERRRGPFGSAVNPDTGEIDKSPYTTISYLDQSNNRYSVVEICDRLKQGNNVVLMGEFGTGKSRCLMQVFEHLAEKDGAFIPVAINLRDNWGYKRLNHIITNHMDSLGLGKYTDNLIRSLRRGNHVVLLDGFDEIGSQSWSGDPRRLVEIRKQSLEGVRDLFGSCKKSGILITGREHYFSSNEEMAECFGLRLEDMLILKCPDEFTEQETTDYITSNTSLKIIPEWMPRKPLICQLLAKLDDSEVTRLQDHANGEVEFFSTVFDSICLRETRINPSINKEVLKKILLNLAQVTREKFEDDERISTDQINESFFCVTGYSPIDESAILLQRLPYLGRIGSGGSDRIFIDDQAKDGLRALALVDAFKNNDKNVSNKIWQQPLKEFGLRVFGSYVALGHDAEKYVRFCIGHRNEQIGCDYVALKLLMADSNCDCTGLTLSNGRIAILKLVDMQVKNLFLSGVDIDEIVIEVATFESTRIENCIIHSVKGVGSADKLPDVFLNCEFGSFDTALTISRISELKLTNAQKTLLAMIKKLFFQPGAGRQEEALLRGAEAYWLANTADIVLQYLQTHDIVIKRKGSHGMVYIPMRKHTKRMANIFELQSSCGDELWQLVSTT